MKQFVKLTNGAVFAIDDVLCIARKDLNLYLIFIKDFTGGAINADLTDYEAVIALMPGLIVFERKPEEVKTKLEIAD